MVQTAITRLNRHEVPKERKWSVEDLFALEEDWQQEIRSIEEDLAVFDQFKGKFHEGPQVLLACLSAQEKLSIRLVQAGTYASLRQSEDGTNPDNQANSSLMASLRAKASLPPFRLLIQNYCLCLMVQLKGTLTKKAAWNRSKMC